MTPTTGDRPDGARVSLPELARRYFLERDVSRNYIAQVTVTVRHLRRFHGEVPYVDELTDELLNRFLAERQRHVSAETCNDNRRMLLTLARYAWDVELLPEVPRRVRRIRKEPKMPAAWTRDEVALLVKATDRLFCHRRHSLTFDPRIWYRALIMAAWDTALRWGDLCRIRRADIAADGSFLIIQSKTLWPVRCVLRPDTLAAIDQTDPCGRELIFGGVRARKNIALTMRTLTRIAGLKGTLKTLRKSAATAVEQMQPGAATALLGHKTPGLAARHYVDPVKVQQSKIHPPALFAIENYQPAAQGSPSTKDAAAAPPADLADDIAALLWC